MLLANRPVSLISGSNYPYFNYTKARLLRNILYGASPKRYPQFQLMQNATLTQVKISYFTHIERPIRVDNYFLAYFKVFNTKQKRAVVSQFKYIQKLELKYIFP